MSGRPAGAEMFVGLISFVYPPANYRYDFAARSWRRSAAPGRR